MVNVLLSSDSGEELLLTTERSGSYVPYIVADKAYGRSKVSKAYPDRIPVAVIIPEVAISPSYTVSR